MQTPGCGSEKFEKEMDILDVWFDSGTSQAAVLGEKAGFGLTWPADLYLEGGDQHRGWFQLPCYAAWVQNAAPYRRVATCGWTLNDQGRALSKSRGNDMVRAKWPPSWARTYSAVGGVGRFSRRCGGHDSAAEAAGGGYLSQAAQYVPLSAGELEISIRPAMRCRSSSCCRSINTCWRGPRS